MIVGFDGDRLDGADVEFARHDRRRHQPATSDGDERVEGPCPGKAPGQRPAVAVKLVPANGEILLR